MEKSKSVPESSCSYAEFSGFGERSNSYNFNGPNQKGNGFYASNDPEFKRKKRIKAYNGFTAEGKLKSSVRNSFKWIKNKLAGEERHIKKERQVFHSVLVSALLGTYKTKSEEDEMDMDNCNGLCIYQE